MSPGLRRLYTNDNTNQQSYNSIVKTIIEKETPVPDFLRGHIPTSNFEK